MIQLIVITVCILVVTYVCLLLYPRLVEVMKANADLKKAADKIRQIDIDNEGVDHE